MPSSSSSEENKNSSSSGESVVSLSYSEAVSFEEVDGRSETDVIEVPIESEKMAKESTDDVNDEAIESNEYIESDNLEVIDIPVPSPTPNLPAISIVSSSLEFTVEDSWSDTLETFLDQLNDIDFDSDYDRDILLKRETHTVVSDEEEEAGVMDELMTGQRLLLCLAVPVLLSQILMLIILSSSSANVKSNSLIVKPIGPIRSVHYYHHHYHHYYYHEPKKETNNGFAYVFFNPFGAIYNSRYFKTTSAWISREYRKQLQDPSSFISQLSHYTTLYINNIKSRVLKLNDVMKSGLENEIGKALRIRDNWNRAVYDKIYKITSTPQYQRVVSTASKWATAIKDRLFS